MSFLLATALMAAAPVSALAAAGTATGVCSWNDPGHNRYRGTLAAAVDRYTDIPAPVRERLKARMASFRYDEMAAIRRDSITGHARYAPEIRDMHFGAGQVCGQVDRSRWDEHMVERGLVYCEGEHCLIVPTVCRNVSRVTRLATPEQVKADSAGAVPGSPLAGAAPAGVALPDVPGPAATVAGGPDSELVISPSAGPSFEATRTADVAAPVSPAGGTDGGAAGGGGVPPALGPVWWPGVTTGGGGFGPVAGNGPAPEPISVGNIGGPIGPPNPPTTPSTPGTPTPPGGGPVGPGPFPGPFPPEPPQGPTEPTGPWAQDTSTLGPVPPPIPEPASGLLALLGVAMLCGWRRLRAR